MERVIDVARYICDEYQKMSGEAIDEMKLHKLLYFSQRESFAVTGKPLFADEFEGWRYGPVCVAVRKSFCQGEIISKEIEKISDEAVYIVSNVIAQYGELASWKLSKLPHDEISWKNARKGLSGCENGDNKLSLEAIEEDAKKVRPYDYIWDMYLDEFEDYEDL